MTIKYLLENSLRFAKKSAKKPESNLVKPFNERTRKNIRVRDEAEITFAGVTEVLILPQKTSFHEAFYIENFLPIVKRYGNI